jgi:predicted phosphoadenosine phosphosulfate sulfurtransferase
VHFTPPPVDQSVTDALADGVVTREEYDRAVANTMRCLDEKGVQHSTPIYQESRRQYTFSVMSPTGPGNGPTEYDDCWMRYERDVTSEWVRAGPPPEHGIEAKALRCARMRVVEFAMNQALNRWLLGFWPARAELRACGNFRG